MSASTEQSKAAHPFKAGIANFIQKNRSILFILLVVFVLGLAGIAIFSEVDKASKIEQATKVEMIQERFSDWKAETNADKKKSLEAEIEKAFADVFAKSPNGYPLNQTQFLKGAYLFEKEDWKGSAEAYLSLFTSNPKSYLAPVALINAAVCKDNAGDLQGAFELYNKFIETFPTQKLYIPQANFSKGRILEAQQKLPEALEAYKVNAEKFPESDWTKLSHARIIVLGMK